MTCSGINTNNPFSPTEDGEITTNKTQQSSSIFSDSKQHYEIPDGLRGIAAVLVVMFHIM